jgi:hypothetical protein
MAAAQQSPQPIHCDGCLLESSPEHLRHRIARLEWASRFRPIHISTLFLGPAPPTALEDFFYYPTGLPLDPAARALFEDLVAAAGIPPAPETGSREPALAALQHRGFYFASCVECPLEPAAESDFDSLLARLLPALLLRIRRSYRPQSVLLLSGRLAGVAESLAAAGLGENLLLSAGAPVPLPDPADTAARDLFRSRLASLLPVSAPPSS